jgi:cardiolipin synthase
VEVAYFLPARLILFQPMNLRNHRKIVVVDGEVGFTGGINIGDEYRGEVEPWRDTHVRIRGPAVARLTDVFAEDWHFATKHGIPHFEPPVETSAASAVNDAPPSFRQITGPRGNGEATVAIVRSGPDLEGPAREAIHRLFFTAITLARSRVYVTTPYFIPDRSILVALQSAALRGVDVRLLFPSRSNHKVVFQAGRSFYEELLAAGVGIYEYGPGMIHAKTMVVDGAVALVGSANMDLRSFRLNFEVHAVVRDAATAAQLDACFEADLALSSRIDPATWRRRSWHARALEGGARFLSPLM